MSYTALYRKFKPKSFDEVKGQDAVVTTLKNQIKTGRIAMLICFAVLGEQERPVLLR